MKPILAIVRKSPTPIPEESIKLQKTILLKKIENDIINNIIEKGEIIWAIDVCKGDDEDGRVELNKHLAKIQDFQCAYCLNVDRFSRSWLGLKWLHKYFIDTGVELKFADGIGNLYDNDGLIKPESYLFFFIQCGFAHYELLNIRRRTKAGRAKLTPEQWKKKFKGRPKGAKDIKKRKVSGYSERWKK